MQRGREGEKQRGREGEQMTKTMDIYCRTPCWRSKRCTREGDRGVTDSSPEWKEDHKHGGGDGAHRRTQS